ncbi:putative glycerol-3-phosphate acyltransferase [Variibacter gotjawalensis]|uniref:Glycerol-3-phosphate acyltransferase n=1 Tax=Variibacter gotjawalensis TaxID=1333996 RepID=A0A0S3PXS3_9BRAD|nr:glycerol-3-phosphate 1-O-acyltransferase PlsY [Variibacter gotjawalensis]NIK46587.1 glycerol-3-phosphate acyltransferase PlsY [Variibacter gotjawalensis]RZS48491.1 acyl-phosphate glycerol-3-phosphate acyltransferase [Variibacter gotjawalensis]BAT60753.1 putative glycerol-3-phosphate acyltransferase [Variibacter gotjawalensis]
MSSLLNSPLALSDILLVLLGGYFCGSIPFGLILAKLGGAGDVRSIGSGNIGATNVLRTGRKGLAAATLLCDILKGTAAVLIFGYFFGRDGGIFAGLGAFLGHLFPVWLNFKGGKGVATYIGVLLGLSWMALIAYAVVWFAVAAATRFSSLAALIACAVTPLVLWWLGLPREAVMFAVMTVLVFIMHRANIQRLLSGTESKIGQKA